MAGDQADGAGLRLRDPWAHALDFVRREDTVVETHIVDGPLQTIAPVFGEVLRGEAESELALGGIGRRLQTLAAIGHPIDVQLRHAVGTAMRQRHMMPSAIGDNSAGCHDSHPTDVEGQPSLADE